MFTYERDDGLVRSWVDHVLCTLSFRSHISQIYCMKFGSNLSDHYPLCFQLEFNHYVPSPVSAFPPSSSSSSKTSFLPVRFLIDWSNVTPSHVAMYQDLVSRKLSALPIELLSCCYPNCIAHIHLLDKYAEHMVATLLNCASCCFPLRKCSVPKRVAGWNDKAKDLKASSNFWHKVWEEAGCPTTGVLTAVRSRAKKR